MPHQSSHYIKLSSIRTHQCERCNDVYDFQVIGAVLGSAILWLLTDNSGLTGTGANCCQEGVSILGGLIAEIAFTFVFVLVVLGTTDAEKGAGKFAGLAIGLSLILVHLACIRYTGTSVNPARSIGPALFQGGEALSQLWIFIIGPFIGAILSAIVWRVIAGKNKHILHLQAGFNLSLKL